MKWRSDASRGLRAVMLVVPPGTSSAVGGSPRPSRRPRPARSRRSRWTGRGSPTTSRRTAAEAALQHACTSGTSLTGATTAMSGKRHLRRRQLEHRSGVRELAVAGPRAAWIVNQGGNSESDDYLYTSSFPRPKERKLASAIRTGEVSGVPICGGTHAGGLAGTWIGCLVGNGGLPGGQPLVDRQERQRDLGAPPEDRDRAADDRVRGRLDGCRLHRRQAGRGAAGGRQRRPLLDGRKASARRHAEHGQGGRATRRLPRGPDEDQTRSRSSTRIRASACTSGAWRSGARYLDVSSKLAAYAAPLRRWPLRCTSCTSCGFRPARTGSCAHVTERGEQIRGVELEPTGLAYAVNRTRPRVGLPLFTPMSRLLR